jgi:hypothetical protein
MMDVRDALICRRQPGDEALIYLCRRRQCFVSDISTFPLRPPYSAPPVMPRAARGKVVRRHQDRIPRSLHGRHTQPSCRVLTYRDWLGSGRWVFACSGQPVMQSADASVHASRALCCGPASMSVGVRPSRMAAHGQQGAGASQPDKCSRHARLHSKVLGPLPCRCVRGISGILPWNSSMPARHGHMEPAETRICGPLPVPLLKRMCVNTCRHAARARQLHCGVIMRSSCLVGRKRGAGRG